MPRPLKQGTRLIASITAISNAPNLALDIAIITTSWSRIDEQFGLLLAHCLRSSAFLGVEMYLGLSGSAAQKAVLKTATSRGLTKDENAKLDQILKEVRSAQNLRNKIVHGVWSFSPDFPNALVLSDLRDDIKTQAWVHGMTYNGKIHGTVHAHPTIEEFSKRMLYTSEDFDDIKQKIFRSGLKLAEFVEEVRERIRKDLLS